MAGTSSWGLAGVRDVQTASGKKKEKKNKKHETWFSVLPQARACLCAIAGPVSDESGGLNKCSGGEGLLRHGWASCSLPLLQGFVCAKGWDRQLRPQRPKAVS